MESKLERLAMNPDAPKPPTTHTPSAKPTRTVADSWDGDDDDRGISSDSDKERGDVTRSKKSPIPSAPPPTPASPHSAFPSWDSQKATSASAQSFSWEQKERTRPETSATAAGRIIAAGLGMKAPRKTEEQKAYDKAVRNNEIQRRNREKEAREKEREEQQKAVTAIWES